MVKKNRDEKEKRKEIRDDKEEREENRDQDSADERRRTTEDGGGVEGRAHPCKRVGPLQGGGRGL